MRRPERAGALLLGLMALAAPLGAWAQALSCAIPATVPVPRRAGASDAEPARNIPTASFTLSLSWSPQYCRTVRDKSAASFQCGDGQRFGFILHGLWADGAGKDWPQYCSPAAILPPKVVRDTLCATPSANLIQHEWAKHGLCDWHDPEEYFGTSRRLYGAIRYPDMMALSRRRDLTVAGFRDALVRANPAIPGFDSGSIRVQTGKGGWLEELWLCLDRKLAYTRCGRGQQGGMPAGQRLRIWRGDSPPRGDRP